jgi:hypothetical protein
MTSKPQTPLLVDDLIAIVILLIVLIGLASRAAW